MVAERRGMVCDPKNGPAAVQGPCTAVFIRFGEVGQNSGRCEGMIALAAGISTPLIHLSVDVPPPGRAVRLLSSSEGDSYESSIPHGVQSGQHHLPVLRIGLARL